MIPPTHPQNVDNLASDTAESTSSHTRGTPQFAVPSTLFRSDQPPPGHEKGDEEPLGEFLWRGTRRRMEIKDSLPE